MSHVYFIYSITLLNLYSEHSKNVHSSEFKLHLFRIQLVNLTESEISHLRPILSRNTCIVREHWVRNLTYAFRGSTLFFHSFLS